MARREAKWGAAAALAAVLGMTGCGSDHYRMAFPSPDDNVTLLIEVTSGGGAAGSMSFETYLLGRDGLSSSLGTFFHWGLGTTYWVDNTTLNVCALEGASDLRRTLKVVGRDGAARTYRLTTDCRIDEATRKAWKLPDTPDGTNPPEAPRGSE